MKMKPKHVTQMSRREWNEHMEKQGAEALSQQSNYHQMRMNGMSPSGMPIPESEPTEDMCDWRKRENGLLCDTDPMPFGRHKGEPMHDVPARYLHWLWSHRESREQAKSNDPVIDYIHRNLSALKQEYRDGIW